MATDVQTFSAQALRTLTADIFEAHDVPRPDAERVADCLVAADLRGVSSHGIGRIPIYTERLRRGLVNPRPQLVVEQALTVGARIDADNALGFVSGTRAMDEAVSIAREHGVGMVFVRRSTHYGMAANYLMQAVEAGLAAYAFTNASPAMPVWGGREPLLGTSPFAFAAPCGETPVVLDMALSVVARGKVRRAAAKGEEIPLGWALDIDGNPTTDARKGYDGIVLPMGGAKGSGLSLMMEIVAGVMSGSAFGGAVRNQYKDFETPQDVGHCFIAMRPDLFMPASEYEARMSELRERCKSSPRAAGVEEIFLPGEPEARRQAERLRNGVPIEAADVEMLAQEAERTGVAMPSV